MLAGVIKQIPSQYLTADCFYILMLMLPSGSPALPDRQFCCANPVGFGQRA